MKKEIIYWAALLSRKGFAAARNGNISYKVGPRKVLITAHNAYLGHLGENEILLTDLDGNILEGKLQLTAEKDLHLSAHRKFPDTGVVLHAHPPYTTALFHYFDELDTFSFEAQMYLGHVRAVPQETPAISDVETVLRALENSNIVVLKNHGVVSTGRDFKEAVGYIELLEEQARVDLLMKSLRTSVQKERTDSEDPAGTQTGRSGKYTLLSKKHIARLVDLVNGDQKARRLGEKYNLAFTLAIHNQDTGEGVCFHYKNGRVVKTDDKPEADFLFVEKAAVLKKLFNREIDPLAALSREKVGTEGNLPGVIEWYPVLVRIFKLWGEAPVE